MSFAAASLVAPLLAARLLAAQPLVTGQTPVGTSTAAALSTAAAPATVLVVPFAVHGEASEWAGLALAESVFDVVVQANQDNFLTMKQLDAVLRRRDLKLADAAVAKNAVELGRTLGATEVVLGEATVQGGAVSLSARMVKVADGSELRRAQAAGAKAALPSLAHGLGRELFAVAGGPGPMTKSAAALELAARCEADLARQSLGARSLMTLPRDRLLAASRDCQAALQKDPALGLARAGLAVTYAVRGKFAEARREATAARTRRFVPLAVLAESFAARRMHDALGARAVLEHAVEARPGFLHALGYLAEDRMELGEDRLALALFERYLARAPAHPWAMGKKARELARLGRIEEAVALSEKALTLDPGDPELLVETASRYIDAGQDERAEPLLEKAAAARPVRPLALLRLGYLYFRGQKLKESRATLEACIAEARREDEGRTRAIAHTDLARIDAKEDRYPDVVLELEAARREGYYKLPCDEPEIARWASRPELHAVCAAATRALAEARPDEDGAPAEP